jgi:hypothetical protein
MSTRLDITIEVSCADKKFKLEKKSELTIMPSMYLMSNTPASYANAPPLAPFAGPSEPPAPPSYEHVPDYSEVGESSTAGDKKAAVEKMDEQ